MKINKIIGALLIFGIVIVSVILLFSGNRKSTQNSEKLNITVTFYPLYDFALNVGGDLVTVTNITPAGSEPHDFDPSPKDLAKLHNTDVFIYNGAGFEPWVERVMPDLEDQQVLTVDSSEGMQLLNTMQVENDHDNETGLYDPHIWLDPQMAIQQIETITRALTQTDPDNQAMYEHNANAYRQKLENLHQEFAGGLINCTTRKIVVSHNAFTYLAKRYDIQLVAISGISPEEEPSPQKMAELVDFARDNQISYIFFETLISPRLSETIAEETGAKTLVLNPLEGLTQTEIAQGDDYISLQKENLKNLRTAMNCR